LSLSGDVLPNLFPLERHSRPAIPADAPQRPAVSCFPAGIHGVKLELEGDLEFMSTEDSSGSTMYTMVAGLLMVCLLTFGMLHTFGVLR
jgi:hypothetical protein